LYANSKYSQRAEQAMVLKATRISPSSGEYIMVRWRKKDKKVTKRKKNLLVVSRSMGQVIYSFYYLVRSNKIVHKYGDILCTVEEYSCNFGTFNS
jgi:hypothetical protein